MRWLSVWNDRGRSKPGLGRQRRSNRARSSGGRRRFISNGAAGLLVSIFGARLGTVLLAGQKPRLQDTDVNKRFGSMRGSREFAREMSEAKADLSAYLGRHFELNAIQVRNIRAFSADDIRALNAALDRAVQERLTLKISGSAKDGCTKLRPVFSDGTLTIEVLEK